MEATFNNNAPPAGTAPVVGYRSPGTSNKVPLSQRFNFRLLLLGAVVVGLVGWPVYVFLHEKMTGGIEQLADGTIQADLKAMSVFPFDQVNGQATDIPQKWRDLNGKKLVLYGEQWQPNAAGDQIAGFQLCYSIAKCCFNGPPQVQHFVDCHVTPSTGNVGYYNGEMVKVVGTFHVDVRKDAGKVASVYQLDVDSVEPL